MLPPAPRTSAAADWRGSHTPLCHSPSDLPAPHLPRISLPGCGCLPSAPPKAPPGRRELRENGLPLWWTCGPCCHFEDPRDWQPPVVLRPQLSLCPWSRMFVERGPDHRLFSLFFPATRPQAYLIVACSARSAVPRWGKLAPIVFYLVSCSLSFLPRSEE